MVPYLRSWLIAAALASPAIATSGSQSVAEVPTCVSAASAPSVSSNPNRVLPENMYVAYWSVWAQPDQIPTAEQLEGVTHVVLGFADMMTWTGFADADPAPFSSATIDSLRKVTKAKIMASFGGWNLDLPFRPGAESANRDAFAQNIVSFVEQFNLDGADIDWEIPVDGSQSYKLSVDNPDYRGNANGVGNADAQNFVDLMAEIRTLLPQNKTLSIAVPARHADMVAYEMPGIVTGLDKSVDYWSLMTYDFMNRRDNTSMYQAGLPVVDYDYDFYVTQQHIDPQKVILGFPMYAKWFDASTTCTADPPIGCVLGVVYEFPNNGSDTYRSGPAWWNTANNTVFTTITDLNKRVASSSTSLKDYTNDVGASAWFDTANSLFWTWVSPADITKTCQAYKSKVRGMSVWSLNQDSSGFPHLKAISQCLAS